MVFPLIALLGPTSPTATSATAAPPGPRTAILFHLLAASHLPRSAWLAAVLLIVLLSVGILTLLNAMLSSLTVAIILPLRATLGARIYRAILHADWTFLTRRRSSDLTHFLTGELNRVGTLAGSLIAVLSNGMVALILLGLACYLAPLLTLILLACFALLIPWQRRSGRRIYQSGSDISARSREVFESSIERLQNLKVVKAFGAQDAELALFESRYQSVVRELIHNQWKTVASSRRFQLVSLALLCALILLGLSTLHLAPGALLVFLFAFVRATPRVNLVQTRLNEIFTDLPAFTEIQAFLAECAIHSEAGNPGPGPEPEAPSPTLSHALTLTTVTFAYTPGAPILDNISLTLPAGRITAIAGLSGAGKSTIADLIMGLLLPQSGLVAADSVPITRANARHWRRHIGYVSQDTLLFHASIRANLLWAKPTASPAALDAAIHAASAHFVYTLPHALDTVVGDRGIMLSHGQRQRIALARALLLEPTLLILDEATNSLDLENEAAILSTVAQLTTQPAAQPVTTLLISHRPSAIRIAHRVYLLEDATLTLTPPPNLSS